MFSSKSDLHGFLFGVSSRYEEFLHPAKSAGFRMTGRAIGHEPAYIITVHNRVLKYAGSQHYPMAMSSCSSLWGAKPRCVSGAESKDLGVQKLHH